MVMKNVTSRTQRRIADRIVPGLHRILELGLNTSGRRNPSIAALLATNSHLALRKRIMLEFLERSYDVLITEREPEMCVRQFARSKMESNQQLHTSNERVHHYDKSNDRDA